MMALANRWVTLSEPAPYTTSTPTRSLAADELFAHGFETWPGPWSIGSEGGAAWGQTAYRKSVGTYSAYCAGSAIPAPGPYENNMRTWMTAGPLDLSAHDAATLSFDVWLDSEPGWDYVWAGVSIDGSAFAFVGWHGYSNGWAPLQIDIADVFEDGTVDYTGEPEVWIGFMFESDGSETFEGAYIDNVRVTATEPVPNTPPVAAADAFETQQDTPLVVPAPGVLDNDTDADYDPLTAHKVADPSHGAVTLNSNGGFTYTPAAGYHGSDSFTYRAYDGEDYSNTVAVSITVRETLPPVINVAGDTRYETAVEAAKLAYPDGAETVVIATGRNWPDALGGSALAGALGGPILLTEPGSLPSVVLGEIRRLGATRAVILGGTVAVGAAVESALKTELGPGPGIVDRIAGTDRYDTANKVALRTVSELGAGYDGQAFVATGGNFPDALAAAPLAAANGWPLFLSSPKSGVSSATRTAMADVAHVVILGGTAAVPASVESALNTWGYTTARIAGTTRYDTACKVAKYGVSDAGLGWNRVGIATGTNYPDALAGGVLQGVVGSVMLLTPSTSLCAEAGEALYTKRALVSTVTFFGGTTAISQKVRTDVLAALDGTWQPPNPPGTVENGVWHGIMNGTTYEGITMNVLNNKITTGGSTLEHGAAMIVRYPYTNVEMTIYVYDDIPITDGAFAYTSGSVYTIGGRKTVNGVFTTASSVIGDASHSENSTSWNANMSYEWSGSK